MEKQWEVVRSEQGPNLVLFQARYDWVRNPRNEKSIKAVVLESADWVYVVAITLEKKVVVERQYRFGVEKTTMEIPAGIIDAGQTPEQAAVRELKEETGYTSASWKYLGWVETNPTFMNNRCHQWLALDVVKTHSPELDEGEAISVTELSLEEIHYEIEQGRMRDSLTMLSLSRVFDLRSIEQGLFTGAG
jgi:8-oxo-dGTP pyrophosphatase MutT (NUDIX family)